MDLLGALEDGGGVTPRRLSISVPGGELCLKMALRMEPRDPELQL